MKKNTQKKLLQEMLKYIPSGAQTLSKYPTQYVVGVTPVAATSAKGVYLTGVDGKKYLDMMTALGAVMLGYGDKRIDAAVKKQIDKGVIFSLPSEKELELAKLLKKVIPCAEMSRFYINGNDATSGAVRLARHITGRAAVAKCGYHGWQDWSIATKEGRNTGVPQAIKDLTHEFTYNDPDSLEALFKAHPNKIGAVILEPVSNVPPQNNFLAKVKEITHRHGAMLIFDEMITGFRWSLGGAQQYFKVTPDLACFGKAGSNGYPLSIVCGLGKYMKRMDEVFVSMTYGGSTLGVVAALETINILQASKGGIYKHMHTLGEYCIKEGNKIAAQAGAPFLFTGYGPHPVVKIQIQDDMQSRIVKTYLYQECNAAGILFGLAFYVNAAHTKKHIDQLLAVFARVCADVVATNGDYKKLKNRLRGDIISPRTVRTF